MSADDKKFSEYGLWSADVQRAVEAGDLAALERVFQNTEFGKWSVQRAWDDAKELMNGEQWPSHKVLWQVLIRERAQAALLLIDSTRRIALEKRVHELEERVGAMQQSATAYKGIWREESTPYRVNELVTHKGTLWHAWKVTSDRPGTSNDWQMMTKTHGKDDGR